MINEAILIRRCLVVIGDRSGCGVGGVGGELQELHAQNMAMWYQGQDSGAHHLRAGGIT